MIKLHIKSKHTISVDATPQELVEFWQLFDSEPDVEQAAVELTVATCDAIGVALDHNQHGQLPEATVALMGKTLSKYSKYGAADSEGYQAVAALARTAQKELGVQPTYR